jgi:hypothetical protein
MKIFYNVDLERAHNLVMLIDKRLKFRKRSTKRSLFRDIPNTLANCLTQNLSASLFCRLCDVRQARR